MEYEREQRSEERMPTRERGFAVPESWAELRSGLGRSRLPEGPFPVADFVDAIPQADPEPEAGEPLRVVVEAAPHPERADRLLVRVGLRTVEPSVAEREPIHLVALVNVGQTMLSVPTRSYPMLQDVLPEALPEDGWYPKVTRLAFARAAIGELVSDLPPRSVVALASFDRGAHVALPPTRVENEGVVGEAIAALEPGLEAPGTGLDLVTELVAKMRSFCGETRVVVFSDGPTGLGGDPNEALGKVAEEASRGTSWSTVAVATGMRRISQLEQLAWVGYGRHHYVHTLSDAAQAFRADLAEPGWVARDVHLELAFSSEAVAGVEPLGSAPTEWRLDGVERAVHRSGLYELTLVDGADVDQLLEVRWQASSPVEGEWTKSGAVGITRQALPTSFADAPTGLQMAWLAGAFADRLSARPSPTLDALLERAEAAARPGVREDVELVALIDRALRARDD